MKSVCTHNPWGDSKDGVDPPNGNRGEKVRCSIQTLIKSVLYFFLLFRAAPVAQGGSKARGPFGATAAGLCHSHSRSEPHLWPTPRLMATPDP